MESKIIRVYELVKPVFDKITYVEQDISCDVSSFNDFFDEKRAFEHMFGELTCDLSYYDWETMADTDYYLEKYDWCFFKKEIHEFLDNMANSGMFD